MPIIELRVPDIGGSKNVNVAEVYIKVGDRIKKDDNLIMLETDKATVEVPSIEEGLVKEVLVVVGSKISENGLFAKLETIEVKAKESLEKSTETANHNRSVDKSVDVANHDVKTDLGSNLEPANLKVDSKKDVVNENLFYEAFASPSIRKLAREFGVNLGKIKGTGRKGRITEEDVKKYVKGVLNSSGAQSNVINVESVGVLPWSSADFAKFGEIEEKEVSRIKKLSGSNLARNWVMIPHVTQFDEANITEMESFRKELNQEHSQSELKVTLLTFLIKACVHSLKKFPEFNSSLIGDRLIYKKYYNIGFAADTSQGLVVPVLKDADKKGLLEIAKEVTDLAKKAKDGKLHLSDMQGGTFTVSSLGGVGGTAFTPIINAPEVAILGVSKASMKPVWNGKDFQPKLILPLSLSYDHRVIDGALAARFTTYLATILSDVRRLIL